MSTSAPLHQAVILAAGEGSRFQPFQTRQHHKSGLSLFGKPIIAHTIQALTQIGITEIIIVRAGDDALLETLVLESQATETRPQPTIQFVIQEQALGMADALLRVRSFLQPRFLVVNPQQLNIQAHWQHYPSQEPVETDNAEIILFSQVADRPKQYGMIGLEGRRVTKVVEKPQDLTGLSPERLLGIYVLNMAFVEYLAGLEPSHYQLEAALSTYSQTHQIIAIATPQPSLSLKYAWDVFPISQYLFAKLGQSQSIHPTAEIHPTALVTGPVIIEAGAKIYEYALIQGPCYIGKNVVVGSYCKVRQETVLEEGVELQNQVEVRRSIIGKGTHIHSGFMGDSLIGEKVRIGAGFITANKRLDRQSVRVPIKGELVETGLSALGAVIGDGAKIGIHCGTNPGAVIAAASITPPGTIVSNPKSAI